MTGECDKLKCYVFSLVGSCYFVGWPPTVCLELAHRMPLTGYLHGSSFVILLIIRIISSLIVIFIRTIIIGQHIFPVGYSDWGCIHLR